jgi:hypothetical protein
MACRRVLTSTLLYLIGAEFSCDLGSETYKLNLRDYIYNYNISEKTLPKRMLPGDVYSWPGCLRFSSVSLRLLPRCLQGVGEISTSHVKYL